MKIYNQKKYKFILFIKERTDNILITIIKKYI